MTERKAVKYKTGAKQKDVNNLANELEAVEKLKEKVRKEKFEDKPLIKGRFKPNEVLYIKQHWKSKSDAQIAEFLHRPPHAIMEKRKSLGLIKNLRKNTTVEKEKNAAERNDLQIDREAYEKLSSAERKEYFKRKFLNTERYKNLLLTLSDDEMSTYIESYLDYLFQFETLLRHEEDTLHLAIVETIRQKRFLSKQRAIRDSVMEGESDKSLLAGIETLDRQYKESVELYSKLMGSLAATREQRLKATKEERRNLTTVVQELQEQENRRRMGEEAALVGAAGDLARKLMREEGMILD